MNTYLLDSIDWRYLPFVENIGWNVQIVWYRHRRYHSFKPPYLCHHLVHFQNHFVHRYLGNKIIMVAMEPKPKKIAGKCRLKVQKHKGKQD